MRTRTKMTWTVAFRHPLVIVLLLYVVEITMGVFGSMRLAFFEPVAWASSSEVEEFDPNTLNEDERIQYELSLAQEQVATLAAENALLRKSVSQLEDLKVWDPAIATSAIPAAISLRGDTSPLRHILYLNRGRDHGVEPGQPVTLGRTLVGVVAEAQSDLCRVILVTDHDSRIPVNILPAAPKTGEKLSRKVEASDPSNGKFNGGAHIVARGVVQGTGERNLRMPRLTLDGISVDAKVEKGMVVVTNGTLGNFPAGLIIGFISEVEDRSVQLSVEIETLWDMDLVSTLTVIPYQRPRLKDIPDMLAGDGSLSIFKE